MGKRVFSRVAGVLRDLYEDPPGQRCVRDITLGKVTDPLQGPLSTDALIKELEQGRYVGSLEGSWNEPRLRQATAVGVQNAGIHELANFARIVADEVIVEAEGPLRERMQALLDDQSTFAPDAFFNVRAGTLAYAANALLTIGVAVDTAANALVLLLKHPCALNRKTAASEAAGALKLTSLPTSTRTLLATSLESLLSEDDVGLFTIVAPALAERFQAEVYSRCEALLASADAIHRMAVSVALRKMGTERARELLAQHVRREPSLRIACQIADYLGPETPSETLASLAARALEDDAPSLRFDGVSLLRHVDSELAASVVHKVFEEEPDPFLREQLEQHLQRNLSE